MSVQRRWPFMTAAPSLNRQISLAEARLDARRSKAKALALSLDSRVRAGGVSPGALWFAGCAGFVVSDWIHRPKTNTVRQASSPPQPQQTPAQSNAAMLIEFALDLGVAWTKVNAKR